MRIISGKFRAKNIIAPAALPVRPTTDFAKTGLFNILNNLVEFDKITMLDLFSGTGNITYECISRGCTNITAVDMDRNCIKFINDTVAKLHAAGVNVIKSDVFRFLNNCFPTFDLIFADPPFDLVNTEKLPQLIFENKLLKQDGYFILEHHSERNFNDQPFFFDQRKYGNVSFSFLKIPDVIE